MAVDIIVKTCPNCSAPLDYSVYEVDGICPHCNYPFMVITDQESILQKQQAICPNGNGNEIIRKLTAIKRTDKMNDSFGHSLESVLSQQIVVPQPPVFLELKPLKDTTTRLAINKNILLSLVFWGIFMFIYFFTPFWTLVFFSPIPAVILAYLSWDEHQTYLRKNEKHINYILNYNAQRKAEFEYASNLFHQLYYCETHDQIFNINTKEYFDISELDHKLYPQKYQIR